MLNREVASKPWFCRAASKVGIEALGVASAAGGVVVLTCGVSESFADAARTYSTEAGGVDNESTAFWRSSVCPSVRALAKCFCIMALFKSSQLWVESKPFSWRAFTVDSLSSYLSTHSWNSFALSILEIQA